MLFEKELFHNSNLNLHGNNICREAVRSIIFINNKILMAYLTNTDEYKFPGGGINNNESYEDALIREVQEEIGAKVSRIVNKIGVVIEYDKAQEEGIDFFKMTSHYYIVEIDEKLGIQNLDDYEKEYGFSPKLIDLREAFNTNKYNMDNKVGKVTKWIKRETFVLGELLKYKITGQENG